MIEVNLIWVNDVTIFILNWSGIQNVNSLRSSGSFPFWMKSSCNQKGELFYDISQCLFLLLFFSFNSCAIVIFDQKPWVFFFPHLTALLSDNKIIFSLQQAKNSNCVNTNLGRGFFVESHIALKYCGKQYYCHFYTLIITWMTI